MSHLKNADAENSHGGKVELICPVCQKTFVVLASDRKRRSTDSPECAAILQRKFNPSVDELLQQMWKQPQAQVAKTFGVRTVTLQARCKKSGILRPPLGYWRLIQLGWSRNDALKHLGWPDEALAFLDEKLGKSV